jgi:hypothetical protein
MESELAGARGPFRRRIGVRAGDRVLRGRLAQPSNRPGLSASCVDAQAVAVRPTRRSGQSHLPFKQECPGSNPGWVTAG